jgi:MFS family permease
VLHLPIDIGALLLSPAAVGVVLGLRVAGFLSHRVPHTLLSTFGFAGFVVMLALLTFANREAEFLGGYGAFWWLDSWSIGSFDGGALLALILVFPLGFAFAVVSVAGQTVMNDRIPLHLQGRVGATQAAMAGIASSVPVLAAGALADVIGVTWVMALLSAGIGVVAVMNIRPSNSAAEAPSHAVR